MQQYETLNQVYEAANQHYERVMDDCFGGLHKYFAASYPNLVDTDLEQVFAVIAYELCKAKAEIERVKWLRDPDRVPDRFIAPLAEMYGIKDFPNATYPEEQRRYMSFAYEIQKYKGTHYGLELLLKSFMPYDEIRLMPMYRRGLRFFNPNNDYSGGRMAGSQDPDFLVQSSAGMPVDSLTQGSKSYPTGIYICVTVTELRTKRVIQGLLKKIEPIIKEFMPENGFYKIVFVNAWLDPYALTYQQQSLTYQQETVTYGRTGYQYVPKPDTGRWLEFTAETGERFNLHFQGELLYFILDT
jgi:hypothetical protein